MVEYNLFLNQLLNRWVNYLSIHSLGGSDLIKAATKASSFTKILSISLLSHHDQKSINDIGIKQSIQNQIKKLIINALKNNVSGLILAPSSASLQVDYALCPSM